MNHNTILLHLMEQLQEQAGLDRESQTDYCYLQLEQFHKIEEALSGFTQTPISQTELQTLLLQICRYGELAADHGFQQGFKKGIRLVNEIHRI